MKVEFQISHFVSDPLSKIKTPEEKAKTVKSAHEYG
jgi:hypothetical protein